MNRQDSAAPSPLAILCGGGSLPFAVADAVIRSGRRVVMFALAGWADRAAVERYPHHWIAIGQLGRLRRLLAREDCRDAVMIGALLRPKIRQIRFDWATLRELPRIAAMFRGGDDHLLSILGRILEDQGITLLGAHEVAPEILVPEGTLGRLAPSAQDDADIARGLAVLAAIGPFDVGQGLVVADGRVLAIEAAEGTDHMLARIGELRRGGRIQIAPGSGVLVKAPKPGQDRRFDLPTIGPNTVVAAANAGLGGVAVAAGGTIISEPQAVAAAADAARLFVVGVRGGEAP